MIESVVVLSDVHGVLPVLDSVLAEPLVRSADRIVVTGDHAAGPMPVETLDRLVELGDRVVLVAGNADRDMAAQARGKESGEIPGVTEWGSSLLRPDQVDLLERMPHPVILHITGFGEVVFCHGTPRDINEVVLVDTRIEKWAEVFADLPESIHTVVGGHTHMPFVRLVDRRLVVNPGSIGMPYGTGAASWAHLEGGNVAIHRTPIDVESVSRELRERSGFDRINEWIEEYIVSPASDVDAIRAFGPRDGR